MGELIVVQLGDETGEVYFEPDLLMYSQIAKVINTESGLLVAEFVFYSPEKSGSDGFITGYRISTEDHRTRMQTQFKSQELSLNKSENILVAMGISSGMWALPTLKSITAEF